MLRTANHQTGYVPGTVHALHAGLRPTSGCETCRVRGSAVCSVLREAELTTLERHQAEQRFGPGQTILFEGDEAEAVYNLKSGTVRLSKLLADGRRQIVGFLMAGDFLGLTVDDVYPYMAEAVDTVTLCRIERSAFDRLCERFPQLEHRLLKCVSTELARAQAHMALLGFRSQMERLALFLLQLHERLVGDDGPEDVLHLPMRRADIADYLGTTVETLARNLTRMRKAGWIELPTSQTVVFKDLEAIEDLAA